MLPYTPGPWRIEHNHNVTRYAALVQVRSSAETSGHGKSEWICEAFPNDAQLIAQAPELRDVCQLLLRLIEVHGLRGDIREQGSDWVVRSDIAGIMDRARAVLKKVVDASLQNPIIIMQHATTTSRRGPRQG